MWAEYFPTASIVAFDIGDWITEMRTDRIAVIRGDQSDVGFLSTLAPELRALRPPEDRSRGFDLIIDDGSHHPRHQMVSFLHLFEHALEPGGRAPPSTATTAAACTTTITSLNIHCRRRRHRHRSINPLIR